MLLRKNYTTIISLLSLFLSFPVFADTYDININQNIVKPFEGHLLLGTNRNPSGDSLSANSLYFTRNGKPWYPVMGEIHYVRMPEQDWEESIIKMKASGIDVIATYVFWIYQEEEEGVFDWSGRRSLAKFASLCKKHDMNLFLRIGPWCHGEVRNGGLPDWIMNIEGGIRRNNQPYLDKTRILYREINKQVDSLYFKNGGPIIGTQIENEFRFNSAKGLEHMLTLKQIALEEGIDVPFYSATGWPGSNLKQNELIPVWGAYPEAPWNKGTKKLKASENYVFGELRNDNNIGTDLLGAQDQQSLTGYRYPYATAEMGGGNQITYHRRPVITSDDVTALAYVKIGSGANLMGYYMYHGGSNLIGNASTFQESKATKYPNDYPIISYDFFSPIGEWGQLRDSYYGFKTLHLFLNDFGDRLAPMQTVFPEKMSRNPLDADTLRMGIRTDGKSGFIFVNNYQRGEERKSFENVTFNVKSGKDQLRFPESGLTIKADEQHIFPFNFSVGGANLQFSTAQPLCLLNGKTPTYVFFSDQKSPEFVFSGNNIASIKVDDKRIKGRHGEYKFNVTSTATHNVEIELKDKSEVKMLILTKDQARNSWKIKDNDEEHLMIFDGEVIQNGNEIALRKTNSRDMRFSYYPASRQLNVIYSGVRNSRKGELRNYEVSLNPVYASAKCTKYLSPFGFVPKYKVIPEDDRLDSVPVNCPGPQYQTNFDSHPGSTYWLIETPEVRGDISDMFLSIDYTGDTGSLYSDGKLIADDFYCGELFSPGLKRFGFDTPKEYLFQVVPTPENPEIYFEGRAIEELKKDNNTVKSVRLIPQYELKVTL